MAFRYKWTENAPILARTGCGAVKKASLMILSRTGVGPRTQETCLRRRKNNDKFYSVSS